LREKIEAPIDYILAIKKARASLELNFDIHQRVGIAGGIISMGVDNKSHGDSLFYAVFS